MPRIIARKQTGAAAQQRVPRAREGAAPSPRFTLRQLEAFNAIALTGSVSAAARQLARTQSALSMTLRDLEQTLDARLFERHGRRLVATEAALTLLPRALEMVERAREIEPLVHRSRETPARLALGASRTVGPYALPGLVMRARERLPGLSITLHVANTEVLMREVAELRLDCAFVEGDAPDPAVDRIEWLKDELCLIARAGHPLFDLPSLGDAALQDQEWVLREPGSGTREVFLRAIGRLIGRPRIAAETDDPETAKRLVRSSDWLSCISRRAIADELARGSLREIPVAGAVRAALVRRFWIVTHPARYRSAAVDTLLELARDDARTANSAHRRARAGERP